MVEPIEYGLLVADAEVEGGAGVGVGVIVLVSDFDVAGQSLGVDAAVFGDEASEVASREVSAETDREQ